MRKHWWSNTPFLIVGDILKVHAAYNNVTCLFIFVMLKCSVELYINTRSEMEQ